MSKKSKVMKKVTKKNNDVNVSDIRESEDWREISFVITGEHMNHIFSNTIIRTTLSVVGAYAFDESDMTFDENSSIFNNDMLSLRFSNTPIFNNNCDFTTMEDFAEKCIQMEISRNENLYKKIPEIERLRRETLHKQTLIDNLHLHINARNDTNDIMYATTCEKDCTFYQNEKQIPDIYPEELHIVALKPKQALVATLASSFNIPLYDYVFASTQKAWHRYQNDNTYRVFVVSYGQMTGRQNVIEACNILVLKFENLRTTLFDVISKLSNDDREYNGQIVVPNDKHTMGCIFTRRIQDHDMCKYAGYKVEHPDDNHFVFKYIAEGMTITRIINASIESLIADYTVIRDSLSG
jgi:DNA-directed RNA polymerase subunit L